MAPKFQRAVFIALCFLFALVTRSARAESPTEEASEHHDAEHEAAPADHAAAAAAPADEHPADAHHEHEAAGAAAGHEAATGEHEAAGDKHEATAEHEAATGEHEGDDDGDVDDDAGDDDGAANVPYNKFDADGDGKVDRALEKEYDADFAGISPDISTEQVDKELEARPADNNLAPSVTIEQFRKAVGVARRVVLARMEKKLAKSSAHKLRKFSTFVSWFSLTGLLLLLLPLVLAKKYPGKTAVTFKYSALAALTFFVTVNLFGGVLVGLRSAQGALGPRTNVSMVVASATFDTLDSNAEEFASVGKELFLPTLEQLNGKSDEQPSVLLLENGQKILKDASVFISIAKMVKKLDFVFKVLPILLFGLTMVMFGVAIRPTLAEIIKLPMRAASGEAGVGRDTTKRALMRVWGELKASVCTVGLLVVITLAMAFVLGEVVGPALDALLNYLSRAILYLQYVPDASSGKVFVALFAVVMFLVMNVAVLVLSFSFFLGKWQKIFQARFNDGVPFARHAHFMKWSSLAFLLVQVLPWIYALIADVVLRKIDHSSFDGVSSADAVSWGKVLLAGPLFLVLAFPLFLLAARGFKAIGYIFSYTVKPKTPEAGQPFAIEPIHRSHGYPPSA